ncbi:MAG: Cysteinyl-tRNA synthetase [Candidatus Parcubacteria bacterium]
MLDSIMLSLYNTLTKKIEPIESKPNQPIRVYSCGPTVYNNAHIGNLRSFVHADTIVRVLQASGQSVRWVMNITDIDDKTIAGAIDRFGKSATVDQLKQYTQQYTDIFMADLQKISIATDQIHVVPISEKVPAMGIFINALIEKGYAYTTETGDVYFNIKKYDEDFHDYGALVGKQFLEGQKIGIRVSHDEYDKKTLSDFALWKAHDPATEGAIAWSVDKLVPGRPGWHIECSVVNHEVFEGHATDIHTGGVDLIFPHHTNEIAQAQPIYKPFVHTWCHSEHLLVDNRKMSKSANNFYTLADIEKKGFDPIALRYLMATTHYRSKINFTWEALGAAQNALQSLRQKYYALSEPGENTEKDTHDIAVFLETVEDDMNLPSALALTWEYIKPEHISQHKKTLIKKCADILGLSIEAQKLKKEKIPAEIMSTIHRLIEKRTSARQEKKYAEADALRKEIDILLQQFQAELVDRPDGSSIITQQL